MDSSLLKRSFAEFVGTFWLVFAGCASAVFAAKFPGTGIGFLGVSLAFGLTLLTMGYAIGHISGCHINPAVTIAMAAVRRFPLADLPAYIAAQVAGGIAAGGVLYAIAVGQTGFVVEHGFPTNGYGIHSPGGYSLASCATVEVVLTLFFLLIILGATDRRAPQTFAPIAMGFGLALANLVGIPVTNCSVNPARSLGVAVFAGGWALDQVWLFWVAPIAGALIGGLVYYLLAHEPRQAREVPQPVPNRPAA
jgi:aquaporin Z